MVNLLHIFITINGMFIQNGAEREWDYCSISPKYTIDGKVLKIIILLFFVKIPKDIISFFKYLYNFLSELNIIFHVKEVIRFTFYVKLIDNRKKTSQEKY